jgi:hypothetical protein
VLAPIRAPITALRTCGGALFAGADGPRPEAGRSMARGRMVRDLAQGSGSLPDRPDGPRMHRGGGVHRRRLNLAPRRDPVGEERS